MNIVIITILLPYPLNSGGAQAQYNMIDRLRKKHRITLIFPENGMNSIKSIKILKEHWPEVEFCSYSFIRQIFHWPFLLAKIERGFKLFFMSGNKRFQVERIIKPYGYPTDSRFIKFVNRIIGKRKADIVQIEFYPFLYLVRKLPSQIKKIFVHHEIRYVRNKRLLANYELTISEENLVSNLKKQELSDLNICDRIVTLTDIDREELLRSHVTSQIIVSPAAVNTQVVPYKGWNGKIIFLGGYSHTPNQEGMEWFLTQVVSKIEWMRLPQAEMHIIGADWPRKFESMNSSLKVVCRGFLENLSEAVCGSIMIVPILSGSGMRMKILEAAALGLPIVTTSVGVEGLSFVNEKSCLVADTPEEYAQALFRIMADEKLRLTLTTCASQVFSEMYSVEALVRRREAVYESFK